ncbi:Trafficking protein particle complex subunit 5 [Perkinsus olseni]|uniref:Trafficking protein particle complex subunit 5 n=1 Tax=Perkinsus olseni TaxID=32597 RepID=A0A7J6N413_PEROL|nr:Trafficking protein particle complex subunit 5 [Perkinsus olseni]
MTDKRLPERSESKSAGKGGRMGSRDYCALTRPILAGTTEVSQAAVSHLFCEMVCYAVRRQGPDNEHLETKLHRMGASLGPGLLELTYMRDTSRSMSRKRDYKVLPLLYHIASYLWKTLFDSSPLPPGSDESEDNLVNCGAFAAGLVEGALNAAGMPCKCASAYTSDDPEADPMAITIIVDFEKGVIERQRRVAAGGSALVGTM